MFMHSCQSTNWDCGFALGRILFCLKLIGTPQMLCIKGIDQFTYFLAPDTNGPLDTESYTFTEFMKTHSI